MVPIIGTPMPTSLIYSSAVLLALHLLLYLLVASPQFRPRFPVVIVGILDYSLHGLIVILYIV
jgi:hypothetical protein